MAERKVLNFYYGKDFDPNVRLKRKVKEQQKVRIMVPFSLQCLTCGGFTYKARKFNALKEVTKEKYLTIPIVRFYFSCPHCSATITFKTDPKNFDYVCEYGATRNYDAGKTRREVEEALAQQKAEEERGDAMKQLENRMLESKREMEQQQALEELQERAALSVGIDLQAKLQAEKEAEEARILAERRRREEEEDEEELMRFRMERAARLLKSSWDDYEQDEDALTYASDDEESLPAGMIDAIEVGDDDDDDGETVDGDRGELDKGGTNNRGTGPPSESSEAVNRTSGRGSNEDEDVEDDEEEEYDITGISMLKRQKRKQQQRSQVTQVEKSSSHCKHGQDGTSKQGEPNELGSKRPRGDNSSTDVSKPPSTATGASASGAGQGTGLATTAKRVQTGLADQKPQSGPTQRPGVSSGILLNMPTVQVVAKKPQPAPAPGASTIQTASSEADAAKTVTSESSVGVPKPSLSSSLALYGSDSDSD